MSNEFGVLGVWDGNELALNNPGVEDVSALSGHSPGMFMHQHQGGNDPGIVFQCTGKYSCHFDTLNQRFWDAKNMLLGEVLTIIDAAITDERQNKATKDLVKNRVIMGFCDFQETLAMLLGSAMIHPQKIQKRTANTGTCAESDGVSGSKELKGYASGEVSGSKDLAG